MSKAEAELASLALNRRQHISLNQALSFRDPLSRSLAV
jgi:hypothetical protein